MRTRRLDALRTRGQHVGRERLRVRPLHLRDASANPVAGQAAPDEDDEAVQARDAVAAVRERLDVELELLVLGDGRGHEATLAERWKVTRDDALGVDPGRKRPVLAAASCEERVAHILRRVAQEERALQREYMARHSVGFAKAEAANAEAARLRERNFGTAA